VTWATWLITAALTATGLMAGEPTTISQLKPALRDEAARLIRSLDAADFDQRSSAAQRLANLADTPEVAVPLAAEFQRLLLLSETSFEVRAQLQGLLQNLPAAGAPAANVIIDVADIDRQFGRLSDISYTVRLGAKRRIKWLLGNPQLVCSLMVRLKQRLADPSLDADSRREIQSLWSRSRRAWLLSDPAQWKLPDVSSAQIDRWIDDLVRLDDAGAATRIKRQAAERELTDLLARDDCRARTEERLTDRLGRTDDEVAKGWLNQVLDWTHPAMVAEIWSSRRLQVIQHLLVGVPQYPEMNPGATFFDRIDEQTAHLVSGNTLMPGDYPVGVAIADPELQSLESPRNRIFHLVNLPTPRRRLAYKYLVRRSADEQIGEISQRTAKYLLSGRRHLSELEIVMLAQLDPQEVSRFIGPYFQQIEDQRFPPHRSSLTGQPTEHRAICWVLAKIGTQEAVSALESVAERGDMAKLTAESPYNMAWIAALTIARRAPWPQVDDWLCGLVERNELLVAGDDPIADLGATAAALLLKRHDLSSEYFGLELLDDIYLRRFGLVGGHFTAVEKRKEVIRWWREHERELVARKSA
jgi:hypothetical protein